MKLLSLDGARTSLKLLTRIATALEVLAAAHTKLRNVGFTDTPCQTCGGRLQRAEGPNALCLSCGKLVHGAKWPR